MSTTPCLAVPGAFKYFVVQPLSSHCTAQICFFFKKCVLLLLPVCSSLKEHCRCLSVFHFLMMTFILTCLTAGITESSELSWTGCLLWSLPPWRAVRRSWYHLWFLPEGVMLAFGRWHSPSTPYWRAKHIDRNPDVSPRSETEQQEIPQAILQDKLKAPLRRMFRIH